MAKKGVIEQFSVFTPNFIKNCLRKH